MNIEVPYKNLYIEELKFAYDFTTITSHQIVFMVEVIIAFYVQLVIDDRPPPEPKEHEER